MNKKLLRIACVTVFFIWLINAIANQFYWYSAMWWFDIPMHILGGVFLGLGTGAILFHRLRVLPLQHAIVVLLLAVLVIGIGWELFEYTVQSIIRGGPQLANISDSIKDICMDMIGGCIAAYFVFSTIKRYNRNHERTSFERNDNITR